MTADLVPGSAVLCVGQMTFGYIGEVSADMYIRESGIRFSLQNCRMTDSTFDAAKLAMSGMNTSANVIRMQHGTDACAYMAAADNYGEVRCIKINHALVQRKLDNQMTAAIFLYSDDCSLHWAKGHPVIAEAIIDAKHEHNPNLVDFFISKENKWRGETQHYGKSTADLTGMTTTMSSTLKKMLCQPRYSLSQELSK